MSPPRMPDRSPSAVTMAFLGRSVLSLRRNQVVSMDQYHEEELQDLDLFQSFVADRLLNLLSVPQTEKPQSAADHDHIFLSFSFLQRLLDVFISCEDEFKNLLARNSGLFAKPPGGDRLLADLLDHAVKSLDVCNAVRQNLHALRHWNRNADIAASAIIPTRAEKTPPLIGEGRLKRAKKALAHLLALSEASNQALQEPSDGRKTERAWSFRCKAACASGRPEEISLQSYSRSWSGPKQVQAMSDSLAAPRAAGDAGGGLAVAVYTMSSVLVFAMWALVAAFPCQERSTAGMLSTTPVAPPKQLAWSAAMHSLQERIAEELRQRGRRDGILMEFLRVEKCGKELMESVAGRGAEAIVAKATELAKASGRLDGGLRPFERKVREVFHRVVDSRREAMKFLGQSTSAPPFIVL